MRANRGEGPETLDARAILTDDHATGSPSNVSTAIWMSLARIGSARSPSTWTTAFSTQPGRRGRCRQATGLRRGPPSARTAASFSARRPNYPCRSWFDRTPISSIDSRCVNPGPEKGSGFAPRPSGVGMASRRRGLLRRGSPADRAARSEARYLIAAADRSKSAIGTPASLSPSGIRMSVAITPRPRGTSGSTCHT
jgi:hypothetical protein